MANRAATAMDNEAVTEVIRRLRQERPSWDDPYVTELAETAHDPFRVLIATLLSLRTKDEVTAAASRRLFALATTPAAMAELPTEKIAQAIYPVGFYKTKAKTIKEVCRELIARFDSRVPDTIAELCSLKGVGRKTANLVLSLGYGKEAICVDTHVHRISNRLGYVRTKTPQQTESALQEKLPRDFWSFYNSLLVAFGRHVCLPLSPLCSRCPVLQLCERVGVTRSR